MTTLRRILAQSAADALSTTSPSPVSGGEGKEAAGKAALKDAIAGAAAGAGTERAAKQRTPRKKRSDSRASTGSSKGKPPRRGHNSGDAVRVPLAMRCTVWVGGAATGLCCLAHFRCRAARLRDLTCVACACVSQNDYVCGVCEQPGDLLLCDGATNAARDGCAQGLTRRDLCHPIPLQAPAFDPSTSVA